MEREVRYCTSADGTRIAYSVEGEGPAIVRCPTSWESIGNDLPENDVYNPLGQGRTVVRYDFRGVGLSQRGVRAYTLDCMTADIKAVADSAGLSRFTLTAGTFSTAPAICYAVREKDQVARLVLSRVLDKGSEVMTRSNLDGLVGLIRSNWVMASQAIADLGIRSAESTLGIRAAAQLRENMNAEDLARMISDLYETVDVHDLLSDVRCPTLIIHRREDTPFSFAVAQYMAGAIQDARFLPLPGSGPVSSGEDASAVVQKIVAFLDEDPETRALPIAAAVTHTPDNAFRTVLFTDLVGHTEMMSRLGDKRGRDVLREHERITREVLKANGGTEVKTMGDGFMASFGSVTKAVECAIALQRAFADRNTSSTPAHDVGARRPFSQDTAGLDPEDSNTERASGQRNASPQTPPSAHDASSPIEPLHARVGLNAGEPIEEDGDLFGATVILASRIAAKAGGGEILVADTVRGLCSGKGFLFADRGEFVAKGFEEPVRISEVSWRG